MTEQYWFPAKRYGWGWGPPLTWQGWVVVAVFLACVVGVCVLFPPSQAPIAFVCSIFVLSAILIAICWMKGEPTRWRWGGDDTPNAK